MKSYVEEKSFVSVHDAVLNCRRKNLRIVSLTYISELYTADTYMIRNHIVILPCYN